MALSAAPVLRKWPARPRELAVIPFSASSLGLREDSAVGVIWRVISKTGRSLLDGTSPAMGSGGKVPRQESPFLPKDSAHGSHLGNGSLFSELFVENAHAEVQQPPTPQSGFCFGGWCFEMERGGAASWAVKVV